MNFSDKTVSINLEKPISGKDLADNLENAGKALGYETKRISDFIFDQQSASRKENWTGIAMKLLLKKTRWSKTYLCFQTEKIYLNDPDGFYKTVDMGIEFQKSLSNLAELSRSTLSVFAWFAILFPVGLGIQEIVDSTFHFWPMFALFGLGIFVAVAISAFLSGILGKSSHKVSIQDKEFEEVQPYLIKLLEKV